MHRVVLAEDDPLILRLALNSLISEEFQVSSAESWTDLTQLTQADPDLVLLDSRLSGHPTAWICEHCRERWPDTKLVLLVGQGPEDEPPDSCRDLFDARLDKPFSPLKLLRLSHRLLGASRRSPHSSGELQDMERQQLLLYARDLARMRREDYRKSQQLRAAMQRLEQLERDKDMFLALISHELRTPLTIIKGNAHLIRRVLAKSAESPASDFAESIVGATDRLERLIMEILNYSGVRGGVAPYAHSEVDFHLLVSGLIREFEPLARSKAVNLNYSCPVPSVLIQADSQRLQEALSHVLRNAILFNRSEGQVEVLCTPLDQGVRLTVRDTGIGVARDEFEKIFLPFYQSQEVLTRRVEGLGLGLAITRHVLEAHGGTIDLESEVGQGTVVKIFVPRSPSGATEAPVLPEVIELPPGGPRVTDRRLLDYARELYTALDTERARRRHAEELHQALERTFLETLAALMRIVDTRTSHERGHLDRVAYYARQIAARIDANLPSQKDFQYSLLLHDIGKIGVAEALLQKVGRLTRDEQEQLRAHSSIGAELVESIAFLRPALAGVRHHHERWDGTGYPDGLAGTGIPVVARIIAVADAFDAMTVDRPYRKAMSAEQARREIEANSGTQFDPSIVAAFQACWSDLEAYVKAQASPVDDPPKPTG